MEMESANFFVLQLLLATPCQELQYRLSGASVERAPRLGITSKTGCFVIVRMTGSAVRKEGRLSNWRGVEEARPGNWAVTSMLSASCETESMRPLGAVRARADK
eukprot:scaffold1901_cov106-Isochrysis_galbana.AAC.1